MDSVIFLSCFLFLFLIWLYCTTHDSTRSRKQVLPTEIPRFDSDPPSHCQRAEYHGEIVARRLLRIPRKHVKLDESIRIATGLPPPLVDIISGMMSREKKFMIGNKPGGGIDVCLSQLLMGDALRLGTDMGISLCMENQEGSRWIQDHPVSDKDFCTVRVYLYDSKETDLQCKYTRMGKNVRIIRWETEIAILGDDDSIHLPLRPSDPCPHLSIHALAPQMSVNFSTD